jgi:hypothetical protein
LHFNIMIFYLQCTVYHNVNTSTIRWIEAHHITASSITPHRPNNFHSQDFNYYPFLTHRFSDIILTESIIWTLMEW